MRRLPPILVLLASMAGFGCRDDSKALPEPAASEQGPATAGDKQPNSPPQDAEPNTYGLPLIIEIDTPEVPAKVMGPTKERAEK